MLLGRSLARDLTTDLASEVTVWRFADEDDGNSIYLGSGSAQWQGHAPTLDLTVSRASGLGQATWSGPNPSVVIAQFGRPTPGALLWSGYAPGLDLNQSVSPGVGQATWQGHAPTASLSVTAQPGAGQATWSGPSPTVTLPVTRAPSVGALLYSGPAPTTSLIDNSGAEPGVGALLWQGHAPSLSLDPSVSAGTGAATWTGPSPTANTGVTLSPGVGAAMWSGHAPSLSLSPSVSPGVGAATWTGPSPSVSLAVTVSPNVGAAAWTGHAPTVSLPITASPGVGAATWTGPAPTDTLSGGSAATLSYIGNHQDTSNATSYTFSGISIGAAASDRTVILAVGGRSQSGSGEPTSVTIGGVSATKAISTNPDSGGMKHLSSLWALDVASGTTADVVVTLPFTARHIDLNVYMANGLSSATANDASTDSSSSSVASFSTTVDVPSNGIVVGHSTNGDKSASYTWSGLATEDFDDDIESDERHSTASESGLSVETGRTITATPSASSSGSLAVASWS